VRLCDDDDGVRVRLPGALVGDPGMMWSEERGDRDARAERVERAGVVRVLELCVNYVPKSMQGTFGVLGHRKTKGALTWHSFSGFFPQLTRFLFFVVLRTIKLSSCRVF